MKTALTFIGLSWAGLWLTPDQQGQRLFRQKEFTKSATVFSDPLWQGTSWYRAGEFEKASQSFARVATPEARFNEGNAYLMLGKYDIAIDRYNKAIEKRPDWKEAKDNRELADARQKQRKNTGGDQGDQKLGADQIVFDKKKEGGEKTEVAGEQATSDAAVQSMWLRRVQTKPADFLRSKFAYQASREFNGENP